MPEQHDAVEAQTGDAATSAPTPRLQYGAAADGFESMSDSELAGHLDAALNRVETYTRLTRDENLTNVARANAAEHALRNTERATQLREEIRRREQTEEPLEELLQHMENSVT